MIQYSWASSHPEATTGVVSTSSMQPAATDPLQQSSDFDTNLQRLYYTAVEFKFFLEEWNIGGESELSLAPSYPEFKEEIFKSSATVSLHDRIENQLSPMRVLAERHMAGNGFHDTLEEILIRRCVQFTTDTNSIIGNILSDGERISTSPNTENPRPTVRP